MSFKPNTEQDAAITADEDRIACVAGAGTGKTATLTRRVAHLLEKGVSPSNILALTFTNKASSEMRERIAKLTDERTARKLTIGTFHSLCSRWLRYYSTVAGLPLSEKFSIFDAIDADYLLGQVKREIAPKLTKKALAKFGRRTWAETQDASHPDADRPEFRVWQQYHAQMMASDAVDFDGLLELFHLLITKVQTDVLRQHAERFTHILVDEFQDTDFFQFEIVRDIFEKAVESGANLFIVADPRQSIYGWRSADVTILTKQILGDDRFKAYPLIRNYRSTIPIVEAANRIDDAMDFDLGEEYALTTARPGLKPTVTAYPNSDAEAAAVVTSIRSYLDGGLDPSDIAVLFRAHYQARKVAEALAEAGIPHHHVGGDADMWKLIPARMILRALRLAANTNDDLSFSWLVNWPEPRLTELELAQLRTYSAANTVPLYAAAVLDSGSAGKIGDLISFMGVVTAVTPVAEALFSLDKHLQISNLDLFGDHATQASLVIETIGNLAEDQRCEKVGDFLDWFGTRHQQDQIATAGDVVTLCTVHGAKGLEWPVVHLVGMMDGRFPLSRADYQEELRLFYVAVTRAKDDLIVSRSLFSSGRGVPSGVAPSPFLRYLE